MDKVNKIIQLKQLVENGVLTETEFNKLKNEIIDVEEDKNLEDSAKSDVSDNSLNLLNEIINNSNEIEGIYFIEDKDLVKNHSTISEISGWSGWSGIAESLGEKNAMKKLSKKAKEIGANVVLITSYSSDFGVKIIGNTYKI
jgi:hypothetical protein